MPTLHQQVLVLGADLTALLGHAGFVEGLELPRHPELEVTFVADMAWLEPNARREMESALATRPQIDLVYGHNDPGAHGAYLAAKEAGR